MAKVKELRPDQKVELKIDDEFKNLIPAIVPEEYSELEKSLVAEGCRDPLVVWNDIILDGHNRYAICQQHKINFKTVLKEFIERDQAKIWIISNQLARRNLSREQMTLLIGERYNLEKKAHGGQIPGSSVHFAHSLKTAEKLAKEYGVNEATVRRAGKFAEAVDKLPPEEKQEILSGKSKKTKQEILGIPKRIYRKDPNKEKKIKLPEEYKLAFDNYFLELQKAKLSKWEEIPQDVIINDLKSLTIFIQ